MGYRGPYWGRRYLCSATWLQQLDMPSLVALCAYLAAERQGRRWEQRAATGDRGGMDGGRRGDVDIGQQWQGPPAAVEMGNAAARQQRW